MKKLLNKASVLLAFVILMQAVFFISGFISLKVSATGITNRNYWNYKNIGQANEYSTADILNTNSVIVSGSGTGDFGTEDSFTYAYIPVIGDCTIQAKVSSLNGADPLSKAGLMIREDLSTNSSNAFLALTKNNGLKYQYRGQTGGVTTDLGTAPGNTPIYLKIIRTGNDFEAFKSVDGSTWDKIGNTQTINMNSKVYVGFATTSSSPQSLCTARFDNVDVQYTDNTPPSAPPNLEVVDFNGLICYIKWGEASDNAGTALYEIYLNNSQIGFTHGNTFTCNDVSFEKSIYILAVDAAGNKSLHSNEVNVVTQKKLVRSENVQNIRLNSIGKERLNARRQQQNKALVEDNPVQVGDEILTDSTPNNVVVQGNSVDLNSIYSESLPTAIDNSTLQCFPDIDCQIYGDCVAWSTTYYMMTHMVGLAKISNGEAWDAKNDLSKVFSPKFTHPTGTPQNYNGIQGTIGAFLETGSATLADAPYIDDGVDGLKVCTDIEAWENAINYRMEECGYINTNENNLGRIKQLLNNGYVLSFDTGISSFVEYPYAVMDNTDPSVNDDYMLGKKVNYMLDGEQGGHQMTIVGYDDNIWWGDVNSDGIPQPEEKGIFKVANSWGVGYAYNGFTYITYDSVYPVSKFNQFNTSVRNPIIGRVQWVTPKNNYQPQLVAEVTVSHAKMSQLNIAVGYSEKDQTVPKAYFFPSALNVLAQSQPFDFNTAGVACDGNFAIDMTDFIIKCNLDDNKEYRWYIMVGDKNTDGSPVVLKSFGIHDKVHDTYALYKGGQLQNDGDSSFAYVDYGWLDLPIGDLNGDEVIDNFDYILINSYLQGIIDDFPVEYDMWAADVNGDGDINVIDMALFRGYLLGNIQAFPKAQR